MKSLYLIEQQLTPCRGSWSFVILLNCFLLPIYYFLYLNFQGFYWARVYHDFASDINEGKSLTEILENERYSSLFESNSKVFKVVVKFDSLLKTASYDLLNQEIENLPLPLQSVFKEFKADFNLETLNNRDQKAKVLLSSLDNTLRKVLKEQQVPKLSKATIYVYGNLQKIFDFLPPLAG